MDNKLHSLAPDESINYLKDYFFPPYITMAHLFHAPLDWGVKPRTLKQYQIQYAVGGTAEYTIEDSVYVTQPGDLLIHYPNELHSVQTLAGEPYICITIVFHFGNSAFSMEDLFQRRHYFGNWRNKEVEGLLSRLISYYHQIGVNNQFHCQSMLMHILSEIHQCYFEVHSGEFKQRKIVSKMVLIKNHIIKHYNRDLQLEELEDVAGISQNYICAEFKKSFGLSPRQYMTLLRIEKAKQLAILTNLSISEIAREVGYIDVHTFGRMFKKKTGQSLSQFCSTLFTGQLLSSIEH